MQLVVPTAPTTDEVGYLGLKEFTELISSFRFETLLDVHHLYRGRAREVWVFGCSRARWTN
jgi:hypothetical protein